MRAKRNGILVTGATGLVGGLLLRRLAAENPNRSIYALVRRPEAQSTLHGAQFVLGDVTQAGLGMAEHLYSRLVQSIETIVHCAACTRFTQTLAASRQVNVHGTRNIAELARRCPGLKVLLHVSSTYIVGRKAGPVREAPMAEPAGWFNAYEQSKFEAEQVICDEASDLPWVIARLSTIAGNSSTGHISQFNYFHQLLRLLPHNPFGLIPGDPSAPVDLVSDDWVTEGLFSILGSNATLGKSVFHLCAGPSQALPAQDVLDLAFQTHRRREPSSRVPMPSFVSPEEFRTFATTLGRRRGAAVSQMADMVLLYMSHLGVRQTFLNTATQLLLEQRGVAPPRTRDFLPRIIETVYG